MNKQNKNMIIRCIILLGIGFFLNIEAQSNDLKYSEDESEISHAWSCDIQGEMNGFRVGFGWGIQGMKGEGEVICTSYATAETESYPVKLRMVGFGPTFEFSKIKNIHVLGIGIGVSSPEALLQSFSVGPSAGVSLIDHGIYVDAAISLSARGRLSFDLGLQGQEIRGIGVHAHVKTFNIKPLMN